MWQGLRNDIMRKKMSTTLALVLIFVAFVVAIGGCSIRANISSKPVAEEVPFEQRVEDYNSILSTAELFQTLDNFEGFSFFYRPPDEYRDVPKMTVTVRFDRDVYLGVTEFQLEEYSTEELKLNLQKLFEEINNAQRRTGS